jgi:TonB family protein
MADQKRILIVDFEPRRLATTAALAARHGWEVEQAGGAQQLEEALLTAPPGVVLIEPMLPGKDGFALCSDLKRGRFGRPPRVILASRLLRGPRYKTLAQNAGADLFLERPAQDDRLETVLASLMEGSATGTFAAQRTTGVSTRVSQSVHAGGTSTTGPATSGGVAVMAPPSGPQATGPASKRDISGADNEELDRLIDDAFSELSGTGSTGPHAAAATEPGPPATPATPAPAPKAAQPVARAPQAARPSAPPPAQPATPPRAAATAPAAPAADELDEVLERSLTGGFSGPVDEPTAPPTSKPAPAEPRSEPAFDEPKPSGRRTGTIVAAVAAFLVVGTVAGAFLLMSGGETATDAPAAPAEPAATEPVPATEPIATAETPAGAPSETGPIDAAPTGTTPAEPPAASAAEKAAGARPEHSAVPATPPARSPQREVARTPTPRRQPVKPVETPARPSGRASGSSTPPAATNPDTAAPRRTSATEPSARPSAPVAATPTPTPARPQQPETVAAAPAEQAPAAADRSTATPSTPTPPAGREDARREPAASETAEAKPEAALPAEPAASSAAAAPAAEPATPQAEEVLDQPLIAGVGGVTRPQLIASSRVDPVYPPVARKARQSCRVILQVTIEPTGRVGDVKVLQETRTKAGFGEAAVAAVKQWRYEPARQDGKPVAVNQTVVINFEP